MRTTSPRVSELIAAGIDRSPTLAAEIRDLADTDVVAFVEADLSLPLTLHGCLKFISSTSDRRYVQVFFNPRLNDYQATAIIAHELRHALEIAQHPEVVDADTLGVMYRRFGRRGPDNAYDSDEAVEIGQQVMKELVGRFSAKSSRGGPAR